MFNRHDVTSVLLIFFILLNFAHTEEDMRTVFSKLEKQLESLIDNQENHYRQAYENSEGTKNETVSAGEQSEKNTTFTNEADHYDQFSEPVQIEELNEAMVALQNKAFEMVKNHAKILGNEASIVEKVNKYEQDVDRVNKKIDDGQGEEVNELLMKKDQVLSEKGTLKNVTARPKMSNFTEDRLLKNNSLHSPNKVTLRDAVARLKGKVENMMETQLKVLENQSKFVAMIDKYSRQLIRTHGHILGKWEERSSTIIPTKITTQKPE